MSRGKSASHWTDWPEPLIACSATVRRSCSEVEWSYKGDILFQRLDIAQLAARGNGRAHAVSTEAKADLVSAIGIQSVKTQYIMQPIDKTDNAATTWRSGLVLQSRFVVSSILTSLRVTPLAKRPSNPFMPYAVRCHSSSGLKMAGLSLISTFLLSKSSCMSTSGRSVLPLHRSSSNGCQSIGAAASSPEYASSSISSSSSCENPCRLYIRETGGVVPIETRPNAGGAAEFVFACMACGLRCAFCLPGDEVH